MPLLNSGTPPRPSNGHQGGPGDSPRSVRPQRTGQEDGPGEPTPAQLEQLRHEIVTEMRREVALMKADIINGESPVYT